MKNNLTKAHLIVFAVMLIVFTVWTFLITDAGVDKCPEHNIRVLQTTAGTISGPLVGAIARGFQVCCLKCSLYIMAYCAPVLLCGIIAQFICVPNNKLLYIIQMTLWIAGWLVWFAGGTLSFFHAFS